MGLFDKLFGKKTEKSKSMKMEPSGMKAHSPAGSATKVKDPVCGMEVDPKTAPAKSEYMGKTYYEAEHQSTFRPEHSPLPQGLFAACPGNR